MRVLVCGSRDWTDSWPIWALLDGVLWQEEAARLAEDFTLIEGGANGSDTIAAEWGMVRLLPHQVLEFKADWNKHGRAAGPIRNSQMLTEGKPEVVFAFSSSPDGVTTGTADMVTKAKAAGLPVYVIHRG